MQKTTIIIPAYNEERRIPRTLDSYYAFFEKLRKEKKMDYEILVSINNSTDKTREIVENFSRKRKRVFFIDLEKGGKGYAVIEGFKESLKRPSDLIGFVDADMSTKPGEFYRLVTELKDSGGVIASRYLNGAVISPKPTMARVISSRIFNALIRSVMLMPYRDTQCGAKVLRKKAVEDALPLITMSQWAFDVDLIYSIRKKGHKIKEVPTVWSDQEYSKVNFMRAGPLMALGVIRLRLLNSYFKDFVKIYDFFFKGIRTFG